METGGWVEKRGARGSAALIWSSREDKVLVNPARNEKGRREFLGPGRSCMNFRCRLDAMADARFRKAFEPFPFALDSWGTGMEYLETGPKWES